MKNNKGFLNAYFNESILKIFNDMIDAVCPKCNSNKIIPVIFGLIDEDEKDSIINCLEQNDLIENPECCPDSYMNEKDEVPTKYCKDCKFYFDYLSF